MLELTDTIAELQPEELQDRLRTMQKAEIVPVVGALEGENERIKLQLDRMEPGSEPYVKKAGYRSAVLWKLRMCNDRLTELKNEVVTMGVFFTRDEDGFPDFYLKAAHMPPNQYKEALLQAYGPKCHPMVIHYKVSPDCVAPDLWHEVDTAQPIQYSPA